MPYTTSWIELIGFIKRRATGARLKRKFTAFGILDSILDDMAAEVAE